MFNILTHHRPNCITFQSSSFLSKPKFAYPSTLSLFPQINPSLNIQIREIRKGKAKKKPKYLYKTDINGNILYPKSLSGYDPDQVETFNKWLKRTAESTKKHLGTGMGDRYLEAMNNAIWDYFNTNFGTRLTAVKEKAKVKRIKKRKIRTDRILWKGIEAWNLLEDKKEDKIFRDEQRMYRERERIPFNFKHFLKEQRDKKRKPIVIEDEETFRKKLEEDQQKYLFYTPKSVRRKYRVGIELNFWKKVNRDIVDPFLHEIRRRGRIAELVEKREDAIARLKWNQQVAKQRDTKLKERQEKFEKIQDHWNKVLGAWHKQNNMYLVMKQEYMLQREEMRNKSREEFLATLATTTGMWNENPNECRFTRFRMDTEEGAEKFPYNKTRYG